VSLAGAQAFARRICEGQAIDKSKLRLFKPFLLDVIFHDCKNTLLKREKYHAFAR
jgi:hypothetical protein